MPASAHLARLHLREPVASILLATFIPLTGLASSHSDASPCMRNVRLLSLALAVSHRTLDWLLLGLLRLCSSTLVPRAPKKPLAASHRPSKAVCRAGAALGSQLVRSGRLKCMSHEPMTLQQLTAQAKLDGSVVSGVELWICWVILTTLSCVLPTSCDAF